MDGNTEFKNLGILWYDEENNFFRMQDVTLDKINGTVSATVTHFSKYMVVDKKTWFDTWQHQVVYDTEVEDIQTVLAIDCSGSMATFDPEFHYYYNEKTTYRKIAAEKFIDAMRTNGDMASIVTFTDSAEAVVHMTNDKEALYDGLSNITSWGTTNLNAAITTSLDEFDESSEASKAIILLTDGEGGIFDRTLQDAVDKGVVIYIIGIGYNSETPVLRYIADYTGEEFYVAKTASEIVDIYSNMEQNQHIDMTDTDGDGLADIFETAGMRLPNGKIVYTDPLKWDTDGDGLSDGEEISIHSYQIASGQLNDDGTYTEKFAYGYLFFMKSDPREVDSDGDSVNDNIDRIPMSYGISDYLSVDSKDELISKLTPYLNEDLSFIQDLANYRTVEEAIDIVLKYDKIITNSSNYYMLPKAYIQSVLLRELMFENILDTAGDDAVIVTHYYLESKEIYDNLDWYSKLFVKPPVYPIFIYREDSSTGLGQIKSETAISALNYLNRRNNINIRYNFDNWRERFMIWNQLRTDNVYNVSMVANVLVFGADDIGLNDKYFLDYDEISTKKLLSRYNCDGDEVIPYGEQVYRYYKVFCEYN